VKKKVKWEKEKDPEQREDKPSFPAHTSRIAHPEREEGKEREGKKKCPSPVFLFNERRKKKEAIKAIVGKEKESRLAAAPI